MRSESPVLIPGLAEDSDFDTENEGRDLSQSACLALS